MIEDVMFHLNKQICVVLKYTKEFGDNEEEKSNSLHRKQPFLSCGGFQRSVNT